MCTQQYVIAVIDQNETPVASDDAYAATQSTALQLAASGLLSNDTDPENGSMTVVLVNSVSHGTLTVNADGSFTYTPTDNYVGADGFSYQVTDSTNLSNVAYVSINVVMPVAPPPSTGSGPEASSATENDPETQEIEEDSQESAISREAVISAGISNSESSNSTSRSGVGATAASGGESDKSSSTEAADQPGVAVNVSTTEEGLLQLDPAFQSLSVVYTTLASDELESGEFRFDVIAKRNFIESESYRTMLSESNKHSRTDDNIQQFSLDQVVINTVIGTSVVVWTLQSAQVIATLLSAAPAWMQLDPLTVLPTTKKAGDDEEEDERERIFD